MKTNDYVRYLTKTVVEHFDTPKDERKQRKAAKKQSREPFIDRWFGIVPLSIKESLKMLRQYRKSLIQFKKFRG